MANRFYFYFKEQTENKKQERTAQRRAKWRTFRKHGVVDQLQMGNLGHHRVGQLQRFQRCHQSRRMVGFVDSGPQVDFVESAPDKHNDLGCTAHDDEERWCQRSGQRPLHRRHQGNMLRCVLLF